MAHYTDWLITAAERGNPTTIPDKRHPNGEAWCSGNRVRPLIHGATYFAELYQRLQETGPGDLVLFTVWRGDANQKLTDDPESEIEDVLSAAAKRGVDVRGLIWRSHWDKFAFSAAENRQMGKLLQEAGAEVLLDMRVRTGGSHHQKFVVIRHGEDPSRDIAYVGGIDLCHSRRDTARHDGDKQGLPMSAEYGDTPPWHDTQAAITGPAVYDVDTLFRERWNDPTALTRHPLYRLRMLPTGHRRGGGFCTGSGSGVWSCRESLSWSPPVVAAERASRPPRWRSGFVLPPVWSSARYARPRPDALSASTTSAPNVQFQAHGG
ncbi:hypothetical protein CGZ93_14180 [Enemella dayhoffiae]|uniref:PLD phosphodiesterase domain-containing protein n=1 Tax=Enemella dayhoffiae TaxID=2016507 RepID=A0A255GS07_9ACTN|nr:phospholipase D-like domain-containing protein [Enemella dayhoffiae]OYO18578.1 hypothetical protein CGZ93_14180 [Enemella dayhoffiae]